MAAYKCTEWLMKNWYVEEEGGGGWFLTVCYKDIIRNQWLRGRGKVDLPLGSDVNPLSQSIQDVTTPAWFTLP